MIEYTTASTEKDLHGILKLQQANLVLNLSETEIQSQGFVTVVHSFESLKKMNDFEQHVIVKDNDEVVAYVLAMTEKSKADIPILIPMFEMFGKTLFNGKLISSYKYIVVGQVCVGKGYRGQGVFDKMYNFYREHFKTKYEFAITEIAVTNQRSINAHKRIGFTEAHRYTGPDNVEWSIVLWHWR